MTTDVQKFTRSIVGLAEIIAQDMLAIQQGGESFYFLSSHRVPCQEPSFLIAIFSLFSFFSCTALAKINVDALSRKI